MNLLNISPFYEFQIEIIRGLQSIASDWLTFIVELITMIGEEYIAIFILAVIYLLFNKKVAQKVIFEISVAQTLNGLIKNFVQEPRPHEMSSDILDMRHAEGYSFPSGHSQMSGVWLNGLAIEIDRAKKIKWPYIVANVLLVLVMVSRMYLGQHFLIDVVCGGLLGVGCAFFVGYLYELYDSKGKLNLLYQMVCLLYLPFAVYFLITCAQYGDYGYSFFKMFGLLVGVSLAYGFEKKYVNFGYDIPTWKKVLRILGVVVVILGIKSGLGAVFTLIGDACVAQGAWGHAVYEVLHFVRYGLLAFGAMGLYPWVFKKLNF
jgi:membrane-associated phospholipid phosphatase